MNRDCDPENDENCNLPTRLTPEQTERERKLSHSLLNDETFFEKRDAEQICRDVGGTVDEKNRSCDLPVSTAHATEVKKLNVSLDSLEDFMGKEYFIESLTADLESGRPHNYIFEGAFATGKTSLAKVIPVEYAKIHGGEPEFKLIGHKTGVADVQAVIYNYIRHRPSGQWKFLIIDEADSTLTPDAQRLLKRQISEIREMNLPVSIIMTTNNPEKLEPGLIESERFIREKFTQPSETDKERFIKRVAQRNDLSLSNDEVKYMAESSKNPRGLINRLEVAMSLEAHRKKAYRETPVEEEKIKPPHTSTEEEIEAERKEIAINQIMNEYTLDEIVQLYLKAPEGSKKVYEKAIERGYSMTPAQTFKLISEERAKMQKAQAERLKLAKALMAKMKNAPIQSIPGIPSVNPREELVRPTAIEHEPNPEITETNRDIVSTYVDKLANIELEYIKNNPSAVGKVAAEMNDEQKEKFFDYLKEKTALDKEYLPALDQMLSNYARTSRKMMIKNWQRIAYNRAERQYYGTGE